MQDSHRMSGRSGPAHRWCGRAWQSGLDIACKTRAGCSWQATGASRYGSQPFVASDSLMKAQARYAEGWLADLFDKGYPVPLQRVFQDSV